MIYSYKDKIAIVGDYAELDGYRVSVQDILQDSSNLWEDFSYEIDKARMLLLSNDNWGKKETQWEEAVYTLDSDVISLVIKQGRGIALVTRLLSNGYIALHLVNDHLAKFDNQSDPAVIKNAISTAKMITNRLAYSVSAHASEKPEEFDVDAILTELNKNSGINIREQVLYHSNIHGELFNKVKNSKDIDPFELHAVLSRTDDGAFLAKHAEQCSIHLLRLIAKNPHTPHETLENMDFSDPVVRKSLISRGHDSVKLTKSYIAGREALHSEEGELTYECVDVIDTFLEWASNNKHEQNMEDIDNTVWLITNLPALKNPKNKGKVSKSKLIKCDNKEVSMSILEEDRQSGSYDEIKKTYYQVARNTDKREILDYLLKDIYSRTQQDPEALEVKAEMSISEASAIGILNNPHADPTYSSAIKALALNTIDFVLRFADGFDPEAEPDDIYRSAISNSYAFRVANNL